MQHLNITSMTKAALRKLFAEFYKEKSKIVFTKTFETEISEDLSTNIDTMSTVFANTIADQSVDLFDIIDKMIDAKLETAKITTVLSAPNGPVTGKITIIGT
jgi:hypothetical protein